MTHEVVIFTGGARHESDEDIELLDAASVVRLSADTLSHNLQEFIDGLGNILSSVSLKDLGYRLDSLSVAVGIDGKGTVGFLGTGAEAGASATLTLEFKRSAGSASG